MNPCVRNMIALFAFFAFVVWLIRALIAVEHLVNPASARPGECGAPAPATEPADRSAPAAL